MVTSRRKRPASPATEPSLRDRVIARSSDRILQEGFSRLTVDEIAAGIGISKKTLYSAFTGKHDIVEAVIDSFLAELKSGMTAITGDSRTFIVKFQQVMILLGQATRRVGRPFLDDLQRQMPDQWKKIQEFRRERILTNFSALIDQGVREGSVRPSLQKQLFLTSYLASVEAVINPSFLMNQSISTREAIAGLLQLFFQGALTGKASRRITLPDADGHITQARDSQL